MHVYKTSMYQCIPTYIYIYVYTTAPLFWVDSSQSAAICTGKRSILAVGDTCLGSKCVTKLLTGRRYILLGGNRIWVQQNCKGSAVGEVFEFTTN